MDSEYWNEPSDIEEGANLPPEKDFDEIADELPHASYRDWLAYLRELEEANDDRLDDQAIVWDMAEGEYKPCDIVEFSGDDDVIQEGRLFIGTQTEF